MLHYLLFWTLLGLIIHFYIIFGTNLLTGGPTQNCCFLAYFSVLKKRNIERSPNGKKPSGELFLERKESRRLGVQVRRSSRRPGHRGAPPPYWACPMSCGAPVAPPTCSFHPYIPSYPKTSRTEDRSGVPPPQASITTKNQSEPLSDTLPKGGSISGGHLHHPGAIHEEEGVVHPRG